MNKSELLHNFKQDLNDADTTVPKEELFSEADQVIILYKGHYPEYEEELTKIVKNHYSFFDFEEED